VGNKDPETIHRKFSPFRIDIEPELSGKIIFQEKIVVSFAEAYPDPLTLQVRYPLHHRPKTGIDNVPPGEPEIEEVTGNDKMIRRELLSGLCAAAGCFASPEPIEKPDEPEVGGVGGTLEVCVRKKDRLHTGTPGGTIPWKPLCSLDEGLLSIEGRLSDLPVPFKTRNGIPENPLTRSSLIL
jgi:hypothetical protein